VRRGTGETASGVQFNLSRHGHPRPLAQPIDASVKVAVTAPIWMSIGKIETVAASGFCAAAGSSRCERGRWPLREAGKISFRGEHAKNGEPRVIPLVGRLLRSSSDAGPPARWARCSVQRRGVACAAAGFPELLFHDLRRSAIRNLVSAAVDQVTAMRISGHQAANVFQRYRIVTDDDAAAALERAQAAVRNPIALPQPRTRHRIFSATLMD
jgi:hypothetical protein